MNQADEFREHSPARPCVTVIGAGLVGLAVAYRQLQKGFAVRLLDDAGPGAGCSYGNAGAVSPGSVAPLALPGVLRQAPGLWFDRDGLLYVRWRHLPKVAPWLLRFVRAAKPERVEEIADALQALLSPALDATQALLRDIARTDLLRTTGQLHVYRDAQARDKDSHLWQLRRSRGVIVDLVNAGEIQELEPAISRAYGSGVFLPEQAFIINPYKYALALCEAFQEQGGEFRREHVIDLEVEGNRVRRVVTRHGHHPIDRLVIAAGAWSNGLLQKLGNEVPLESQRGYHVTIPDPGVALSRPVVAADRKVFLSPMDMGMRIAGTVEFAGLQAEPDYRRAELLLEHGTDVLPDLRNQGESSLWMGHRPCLPDSLPVIGRSPWTPDVWFAFGHGHLGLTGAAVTGEIVAAAVAGEPPNIDLRPYRADRF